jgi:isoleucyl-tRNA synthetase
MLFVVIGVGVHPEAEVSFLVWTTTPWTIPLNRALVLNPLGNYALLYMRWDDPAVVITDQPTATAATSSSNAGDEAEEQLKQLFDRQYLVKQSSVLVLVGEELAEKLAALFKCRESRILAYFPAIFFERSAFKVQHPLVDNLEVRYTATNAHSSDTHSHDTHGTNHLPLANWLGVQGAGAVGQDGAAEGKEGEGAARRR